MEAKTAKQLRHEKCQRDYRNGVKFENQNNNKYHYKASGVFVEADDCESILDFFNTALIYSDITKKWSKIIKEK